MGYIALIALAPKGVWNLQIRLQQNLPAADLVTLLVQQAQRDEVGQILNRLSKHSFTSDETFAYAKDKLFRAIDYAIRRHDWYEDQRSRVFQQTMTISLAILTISLTISSIAITNKVFTLNVSICMLGFILLALISIIGSAHLYNSELDRDRPYRLVSDIRFWYFRYNLPKHSTEGAKSPGVASLAEGVLNERKRFFDRVSCNLHIGSSMREDLEQLFILQVLQRYKSESLTKLRWLLSYLAIFASLEFLLSYLTFKGWI